MISRWDKFKLAAARLMLPAGFGVGMEIRHGLPGVDVGVGGGRVLAYDAARTSRRDPDWQPQGLGVNALAESFGGLPMIRARARDLADNNPLMDGAAWSRVDGTVRTGLDDIDSDLGEGESELEKDISRLWRWAFRRCDPERRFSVAEVQEDAERELAVVGEVGIYRPIAPAFNGYPMMPALELIEAERIAYDLSGIVPAGMPGAGNTVRQGVEYDALNRIVAYHVLTANPKDTGWGVWGGGAGIGIQLASFGSKDLRRLTVDRFTLLMDRRRLKQLRGVPPTVSVMNATRTEDLHVDANLNLANLCAAMGVVMETPNADLFRRKGGADGERSGEYPLVDAAGKPITRVTGLQVMFKRPGTSDPKVIASPIQPQGFEMTLRVLQRRLCRALGLRYDEFSGDYSQTTFASGKLGLNDQKRREERRQMRLINHTTLAYARDVIDWALLTGRLELSESQLVKMRDDPEWIYGVNIGLPPAGAVNPAQEATAHQTELDAGINSPINIMSGKGLNPRKIARERAKWARLVAEERKAAGLEPEEPRPAAAGSGGGADGGDAEDESESAEDERTRARSDAAARRAQS